MKTDTEKHSYLPWTFVYDNDTGPNDEGFSEFYRIESNGATVGQIHREVDASLITRAVNSHDALLEQLSDALRYIEVSVAYKGAMTAEQVEKAIADEHFPSWVSIGANSCNTLAKFDIAKARSAIALAKKGQP